MSLSRDQLLGTWMLDDFTVSFADRRPATRPFGAHPMGMLVYAADGHVSAVLSRADRAPLGVSGLEAAGGAEAPAKAGAFDGYLSYAGTWTLGADTVTHHVAMALVPDAVGRDQVRAVALAGGVLTLSYDRTPRSGVTRTHTLQWRRPQGET